MWWFDADCAPRHFGACKCSDGMSSSPVHLSAVKPQSQSVPNGICSPPTQLSTLVLPLYIFIPHCVPLSIVVFPVHVGYSLYITDETIGFPTPVFD